MKRPKVIYANSFNLSGLYSLSPLKLTWCPDSELYFDKSGDYCVEKVGRIFDDGCIYFSSPIKEEVDLWTNGALAVLKMISSLCPGNE
jgi:hypothetical protein